MPEIVVIHCLDFIFPPQCQGILKDVILNYFPILIHNFFFSILKHVSNVWPLISSLYFHSRRAPFLSRCRTRPETCRSRLGEPPRPAMVQASSLHWRPKLRAPTPASWRGFWTGRGWWWWSSPRREAWGFATSARAAQLAASWARLARRRPKHNQLLRYSSNSFLCIYFLC